ncbi:MAG TPA: hypothetical protein VM490_14865 [Armatimonadaceae bacterium]|nr:hypothetical protein [Armatimonadaceae bacterium]
MTRRQAFRAALTAGFSLALLLGSGGCGGSGSGGAATTFTFDFDQGVQGWTHGFADYPVDDDANFEFLFDASVPIPDDAVPGKRGARIGGSNRSDDLFMFLKQKVSGLEADRTYRVRFDVRLASNAPSGGVGAGGGPGESVTVKAGAVRSEPKPVQQNMAGTPYWRMNVEKGDQSVGGRDVLVLGNIGVPTGGAYVRKDLTSGASAFTVTTDSTGSAWLLVGTDSGYEGRTVLYYSRIEAVFTPL